MVKQYREMVNTRKIYKLESALYHKKPYQDIIKQRRVFTLRKLAQHIWKSEKMTYKCPEITFGKGIRHGKQYYSWCNGQTIELAPKQRDVLTLIHELVHAMGYGYHNKSFIKMEMEMLMKYAKTNPYLIYKAFSEII